MLAVLNHELVASTRCTVEVSTGFFVSDFLYAVLTDNDDLAVDKLELVQAMAGHADIHEGAISIKVYRRNRHGEVAGQEGPIVSIEAVRLEVQRIEACRSALDVVRNSLDLNRFASERIDGVDIVVDSGVVVVDPYDLRGYEILRNDKVAGGSLSRLRRDHDEDHFGIVVLVSNISDVAVHNSRSVCNAGVGSILIGAEFTGPVEVNSFTVAVDLLASAERDGGDALCDVDIISMIFNRRQVGAVDYIELLSLIIVLIPLL